MLKMGIIHVHSKFSYDGQHTLEEIALLAKQRKYDFVGLTEHSESFDADKMKGLVQECRRLSTPQLLLIPGVEFACTTSLHILGLGIERFEDIRDPIAVAKFVTRQGGLAIVAHPIRGKYTIPTNLEFHINGIEVWNARYDGCFVPNDRAIALWHHLRRRAGTLVPLGGQDLHETKPRCHVKVIVPCAVLEREAVLQALRHGRLTISNSYLRFRPEALVGPLPLILTAYARRAYLGARWAGKGLRDRVRALRA